jgi:NAD(P)-binding Rossmann-like domain
MRTVHRLAPVLLMAGARIIEVVTDMTKSRLADFHEYQSTLSSFGTVQALEREVKRGYDAVVVGAGPNGLAAAVALAREGHSILVLEAADTPGGGARSAAVTLPGFLHDVCSAVHPMALASPFFRTLPLAEHGLEWVQPPAPAAHPLDDGTAAVQERSVAETAHGLGQDARAYERLMGPLARSAEKLFGDLLGPFRLPRHPFAAARFASVPCARCKGWLSAATPASAPGRYSRVMAAIRSCLWTNPLAPPRR